VKLPDKVWLKNTFKVYLYFCLLFGIITITLMIIKTVLHGFDKVYLDIIFSLTFYQNYYLEDLVNDKRTKIIQAEIGDDLTHSAVNPRFCKGLVFY